MAGGVVDPDTRDYIHGAGFFVLELTGESVSLVKPEVKFEPREGLERIARKALDENWTLFLRAYSQESGENVVFYTKFSERHLHMLMITTGSELGMSESEIVLMQMKLSRKAFEKWMPSKWVVR